MIRGISSSPIQLNRYHHPPISNFAYLQMQDSHHHPQQEVSLPPQNSYQSFHQPSYGRTRRRAKKQHTSLSDALSANITLILEDLLKDYDKTERPGFKRGNSNVFYTVYPATLI